MKKNKRYYFPNLTNFEATDWEIFEENKFGEFKVTAQYEIYDGEDLITCTKADIDNLEKAIKRARELQ